MKKYLIPFLLTVLGTASCSVDNYNEAYPVTFAHRGCWIENFIPENSVDGVTMAARYGYPTIECDVKFTLDSVLVLMHDGTINRTMRNASDYSPIEEKVKVKETDFNTLRNNYIFASDTISCRKCIPTFAEFMDACEREGIKPILHCDIYEGYIAASERLGSNWIAFTEDYELCKRVRALDSDVLILYSPKKHLYGLSAAQLIEKLDSIGGSCGISSMHYPLMRKTVCDSLRAAGYTTQSSIFPAPHEMEAISNGAEIILSDFCWFPMEGDKPTVSFDCTDSVSIERTWPREEFACMTINISCTGHYTLSVNGSDKVYDINNGGEEIRLGYRIYNTEPSVSVVPAEDSPGCSIDRFRLNIYRK